MPKKSYEEQLAELEKKQEELKEAKKQLIAKHKKEERKKENHTKFILGGTVLSVLGRKYVDGDEYRLREFLEKQEKNGSFFSRAMNKNISATYPDSQTIVTQNTEMDDIDEQDRGIEFKIDIEN